jgi:hypothetical protein
MGTLRDFSNRFWSFVSPRKTQQRRVNNEYKVKVPALPQHKKKENPESSGKRETSPTSRIEQWGAATLSLDESVSVDGAHLPPSPPKSLSPQSSPSSATSLERPYTNPEGDTLINEMQTGLNQTSGQDWDANEETFVVDAERYIEDQKSDDADLERDRRELQSRELRAAGWSEDAIFLFQKLGLRGFEPLLPYAWINDFRMLPTSLFTRNRDKAFIKPMNEAMDHHGMYLCVYVRPKLISFKPSTRWRRYSILVDTFATRYFRKLQSALQSESHAKLFSNTTNGHFVTVAWRMSGRVFLYSRRSAVIKACVEPCFRIR